MAYNILIADDSATMRSIIGKALRLSGLPLGEIHAAGDGHEALEKLKDEWVDLVLADLNMPRMGGVELIERMRHEGIIGKVPVVIVSTEGRRDIIDALVAGGATAFLRKPFAPEEIGSLITSILGASATAPDDELLATSFAEALEGFAMLVGDVAEQPKSLPAEAVISSVRFVGSTVEGDLMIAAGRSACAAIVESALGESGGDGEDALAELANLTAGQLIDRLSGGPFALHPPEGYVADGAEASARVTSASTSLVFDVEGMPLLVGADIRKRLQ